MLWLNEPPSWREKDGVLTVTTGEKTDFWRVTHYDFIRDNGHFRFDTVAGDFAAEVTFSGDYRELYDQAGLMLRIDPSNWMKAGIELVAGRKTLSVVATCDFSDWSTMPLPQEVEGVRIRASRQGSALRVEWAPEGEADMDLLRLAYLPPSASMAVGPMCCSPQRGGFEARFWNFAMDAAPELHA